MYLEMKAFTFLFPSNPTIGMSLVPGDFEDTRDSHLWLCIVSLSALDLIPALSLIPKTKAPRNVTISQIATYFLNSGSAFSTQLRR